MSIHSHNIKRCYHVWLFYPKFIAVRTYQYCRQCSLSFYVVLLRTRDSNPHVLAYEANILAVEFNPRSNLRNIFRNYNHKITSLFIYLVNVPAYHSELIQSKSLFNFLKVTICKYYTLVWISCNGNPMFVSIYNNYCFLTLGKNLLKPVLKCYFILRFKYLCWIS